MNLLKRSKLAVSPVVATVLVIALTVSSGAVVWVLVNEQMDNEPPTFSYSVIGEYDYNNDGLIDMLDLRIRNIDTKSGNVSYVWNENWEVVPGYTGVLDINEETQVKIGTGVSSSQFEPNSEITIGIGPSDTIFKLTTIKLTSPVVPSPTTISVRGGPNPVVGTTVTFTNDEGLPAAIAPLVTDSNGEVQAYLLPDIYTAKTSSGDTSDPFHNVVTNKVIMGVVAETINVKVLDNSNNPISGMTVYNADTNQNDLGNTAVTDVNGSVSFILSQGTYLFRVNYLGQNYWSSSVTLPGSDGKNMTIKISTTATLIGKLLFGGIPGGSGKLLRLFTISNTSLGRYDYTNTTSYFEFLTGISSGVYRLRLDFQGNYYWSGIVSTSDSNLEVDFGGGSLNVLVTAGGSPLPNGVLTRLFKANNVSAGRYDYLNASGVATYTATPASNYLLRIDWLGQYFYTPVFTHSSSDLLTVDIGGGQLNILVTAGGSNLPTGVLTRLFKADNSSAGRYDYLNSSAWAEYGAIPGGDYLLRVDWLGQYFYSKVFTHDGSPIYVDLDGGALNVQVLVGGAPLSNGVLTRLFKANNVSAGRYDYVNSSGIAEYGAIPASNYLLRVDWLGQYFYTPVFTHSNETLITVTIAGGALNVLVLAGGSQLPTGVLTRLFKMPGNSSAGRYDYLNASGIAEYGAIPAGQYLLRIDWLGNYYYTPAFTHNGSLITVDIGGGSLNVLVTAGGTPLPTGVLTRLFKMPGNSSAGRYDYLNASGIAEYGPIPNGDFLLRIDWLGQYFYTPVFTHNNGSLITVDIGGGFLNVLVTAGGTKLPTGVLTRLFKMPGNSSAGRYDYLNGSGIAEYGTIPTGQYLLRIDWLGNYYYTPAFTHNGSLITVDIGGGLLNISVEIGGTPLPNAVLTRLFNGLTNSSAGRYDYLNSSGVAEYGPIPGGWFRLRIDWTGKYYFTSAFLHNGSSSYTLTLPGVAQMQIHVTDAGALIPAGRIVRLYHSDGTNTGRYAYTDVNSNITISTVMAGDYKLYYSTRFSANFTAASSLNVDIPVALSMNSTTNNNVIGLVVNPTTSSNRRYKYE